MKDTLQKKWIMVSIKDIAKKCNVSSATVSKALNGYSDIGEATRESIRKTAIEMGYMPNLQAKALRTNRTYNLGVLFVDETKSGLSHEYFSSMLESIKTIAGSNGYDITFINRDKNSSYLQRCAYRGIEGVIIASVDFDDPQVLELINSNLPVVAIDHEFDKKVSVMSDNTKGSSEIMQYVLDMGHRNIGVILGEDTTVTRDRLNGYVSTCAEAGVKINPENIKRSRYHDTSACYFATKELISHSNRPTCILFPDDYSSIGGMNAIRDSGLSIPEDISVVGYDGIKLSRILSPRLVTYHQNAKGLGEIAVAKLLEQIEKPDSAKHEVISVTGEMFDGGSVQRL